jgi:hypothetical protein
VAETPENSPQRAVHIALLANALRAQAEETQALAAYRSALADPLGPLEIRISAARAAATMVSESQPALAADLLETAVGPLPEVSSADLSFSDRQYELSTYARLAADAAALALSAGSPPLRALRLLESGRLLLLNHIGQNQPLPGEAELRAAAAGGPIVVVNISGYRSDAILITADGLDHLPLPELSDAPGRFHNFRTALNGVDNPESGWRERAAAQQEINATLEWLWDAVAEPVLDALGYSAPGESLPRVWWVPGGMLSVFPCTRPDITKPGMAAPRWTG